jgi:hypothetical protein
MAVMNPATSERNFTPSSSGVPSETAACTGTAVLGQMVTAVGVAATAMLSALLLVAAVLAESRTRTVKLDVATAAGVPLIAPVAASNVNPPGSEPPVMDQLYGPVPPAAANAPE